MATFTDVDTEQIRLAAQNIKQNIESIKRIGNELESNVPGRLVPCWQGEAKDLFIQQFTAYNTSLKSLIGEYEALNNDLEAADRDYRQANEQVSGQLNKMQ